MVYLPSPLLTAEMPDWMRLHFQVDQTNGWSSPQVIPEDLQKLLRSSRSNWLRTMSRRNGEVLADLKGELPPASIMTTFREMGVTASEESPGRSALGRVAGHRQYEQAGQSRPE